MEYTGRYVLAPESDPGAERERSASPEARYPVDLLERHAHWFCNLRWLAVIGVLLFGISAMVETVVSPRPTLAPHLVWPFVVGLGLATLNIAYLFYLRFNAAAAHGETLYRFLFTQSVLDLFFLTGVVHFVGSVQFLGMSGYLFHIVLACVFYSRRTSLWLTLIAVAMYSSLLILEWSLASHGAPILFQSSGAVGMVWFHLLSFFVVCVSMWYLTARISVSLRRRESELRQKNALLVKMQAEKISHALRSTHELKAPFSAVHANIQAILGGYCGDVPEKAIEVLKRVDERSEQLGIAIQKMLHLSRLNAAEVSPEDRKNVDVEAIAAKVIEGLSSAAVAAGVEMDVSIEPFSYPAVEEHLYLLVQNVLSNAVNASEPGKRVMIVGAKEPDGRYRLTVRDEGIGIAAHKLSRIFEEHYRTEEGTQRNRFSCGLGLAIVRVAANLHRLTLEVESEQNTGTRFSILFPQAPDLPTPSGRLPLTSPLSTYPPASI